MKIEVVDSFQRYGDLIQLKWQQRHSNSFSKHRANQVWNRFLIHASDTERIFHKYVLYFFLSPRKRISTTIFFYDAHHENQADSSDFAEDADIDEDDAEKLFVVIHSIVQKALYKSPLEDSDYPDLFPEGDIDGKLKKLIAKILKNRLSIWREVASNQCIALPKLVDFDWRLDFKSSSDGLSVMAKPSAMLNLTIRQQPEREHEMPDIKNVDFEMDRETLDVVVDGLGKIRDQLSRIKT